MKIQKLLEYSVKSRATAAPSPAIKKLMGMGPFDNTWVNILDYGSGRYSPNADYMRDLGLKVYSFDPHFGASPDGWKGVSKQRPHKTFDFAITTFLLDRLDEEALEDALMVCESLANKSIQIVRKNKNEKNNINLEPYNYKILANKSGNYIIYEK